MSNLADIIIPDEFTRPPHEQDDDYPAQYGKFSGCQFLAFLRGEMKFVPQTGEAFVTFRVPVAYAEKILPLMYATAKPLSIDVQLLSKYRDATSG